MKNKMDSEQRLMWACGASFFLGAFLGIALTLTLHVNVMALSAAAMLGLAIALGRVVYVDYREDKRRDDEWKRKFDQWPDA